MATAVRAEIIEIAMINNHNYGSNSSDSSNRRNTSKAGNHGSLTENPCQKEIDQDHDRDCIGLPGIRVLPFIP